MPKTPSELFTFLHGLGVVATTHEHEAVFTVAESRSIHVTMTGAHSKNLFLKDRKGRLFLVVARQDTEIDLKRLHECIGASGRLSFGSAELLQTTLAVEPGSVTPFAVINDLDQQVTVVLDETLMAHERLNFHPLVNTMTTGLCAADLLVFLRATGHEPLRCRLPGPVRVCDPASPLPSS